MFWFLFPESKNNFFAEFVLDNHRLSKCHQNGKKNKGINDENFHKIMEKIRDFKYLRFTENDHEAECTECLRLKMRRVKELSSLCLHFDTYPTWEMWSALQDVSSSQCSSLRKFTLRWKQLTQEKRFVKFHQAKGSWENVDRFMRLMIQHQVSSIK